jgi:alkanesulfonate monooxygenase SsuD/methylene tetrahydromethanopterin reductase-like flavin-dependent oxidoreductase (luciferase family)
VAVGHARRTFGYDLARYTDGRFILGLGPQIKPHIERRFSMPWSHPAPRMRELVMALRAIWACWHEGVPLDSRGEFYTHTLMTPNFPAPAHPAGHTRRSRPPARRQIRRNRRPSHFGHALRAPPRDRTRRRQRAARRDGVSGPLTWGEPGCRCGVS